LLFQYTVSVGLSTVWQKKFEMLKKGRCSAKLIKIEGWLHKRNIEGCQKEGCGGVNNN
jgi:hypothetical protein